MDAADDVAPPENALEQAARPDVKGAQSLFRALDLLESVGARPRDLAELSGRLGLSKSTCHRLASALVQRRYLSFTAGEGYALGPKLLELGFLGQAQHSIVKCARPILQSLCHETGDTVHLATLDGGSMLFVDKLSGRRRFEFRSRVGERYPIAPTAVGKALVLDQDAASWRSYYDAVGDIMRPVVDVESWLRAFHAYVESGYTLDRQESDPNAMCVAAPVRAAGGKIIAAISVSSTIKHMDEARVAEVAVLVKRAASLVSAELGFSDANPQASLR
ncbi:IclR family transcriptional regulator [Chelatococcus reniformis]|uniref:IclR family transcriptional regulator n=1 Tax=Chelatococcus reniformis TaxID=1494448 RepID=A0A916U7Z5_9HYPH|nr:IclR family transcriptional regulator [Chelatococcus reniformis]GGC63179.1 IclR family transcriptional regulator [Chelatococcus reniformis]